MLNQTTMMQQVDVPMIVDRFMVASRTDATRGIHSVRGIEITPDLIRILSGPTSNFVIFPSTAGREIQTDKSKNSGLTVDRPSKPSTKLSAGRNNTKPKQPNPTLNRTYNSVLRPLPHAS
jgi:hypothetical protein